MKKYDVASVCNALVDVLMEVDESDIKALELTKGIMHLVDGARQKALFKYLQGKKQHVELGGSSMNAIRTLAALGHKTVFAGMVADDDFGLRIKTRMQQLGIKAFLGDHVSEPTGSCVILITPDGERTMNTHLGASRLYDATHIPHAEIAGARLLHFCGYQWDTPDQKEAVLKAIRTARDHATLVSFDVADPFVVERNRSDFLKLIAEEADLVFANKAEAQLLFESTPQEAARRIAGMGAVAIIKLGAEGALIARGTEEFSVAPVPTDLVDTTAAGDMFAAGFLHGYLSHRDLATCGKMAATMASDVISRIGATVSDNALATVARM